MRREHERGRGGGAPAGARAARLLALAAVASGLLGAAPPARALAPELETALREARYVYVASERKGGSLGAPAEIWFMHHQGAVWVASPTTTWRVRRIRAGRARAQVAIGRRDGPAFAARGSIVRDPALYEVLFRALAEKYPEGWPQYESRFRSGLADGTRVLIKYQPVD
jgi:hypothetical protein